MQAGPRAPLAFPGAIRRPDEDFELLDPARLDNLSAFELCFNKGFEKQNPSG